MNKTESIAYAWLKKTGHNHIVFDRRDTPDFYTDKGAFEIKKVYGVNTLVFTPRQKRKILDAGARILAFKEGGVEPWVVLEPTDISDTKSPGMTIEKKGVLLHISGGYDSEDSLKMRINQEIKAAWVAWIAKLVKETGASEVSYEEALEELLRRMGMLPPKGKVY